VKLIRRYQMLPLSGHCRTCEQFFVSGDVAERAGWHARHTGHEVRITETRLIIITQPAAVAR
jgi:hypothetical protein